MLADYFARNSTAAAQILANFDEAAFKDALNQAHIGVAWDTAATRTSEGRATLDLLIRLLARLYPTLTLLPLDVPAKDGAARLEALAKAINPRISIRRNGRGLKLAVVVGGTSPAIRTLQPIYIGSDGWVAKVSRTAPVGSGRSTNCFGAGAAACLGAANVFRTVFNEQLGKPPLDDSLEFSLLDPNLRDCALPNPSTKQIDVGNVHIVGLGAIGNGILWALGRSDVRGEFHVIDKERIDLGNLQRYVMALRSDEDAPKSAIASRTLKGRGRRVVPYDKTWAEVLDGVEDWRFDQVLVALDSAEDRIALQASVPRWIANGWTRGGEAGLSVHEELGGDTACLACLYIATGPAPAEDKIIADALGISDVMEVRRRLDVGIPLDEDFLFRIAQAKGVPIERLRPFLGKAIRDFYMRGVCGGQLLEFTVGNQQLVGEVPMAFQSAFAGIMVAGQLVARQIGRRGSPNLTQVDLLRRFPDVPGQWRRKVPDSRCICRDPDYLAAYAAKYASN